MGRKARRITGWGTETLWRVAAFLRLEKREQERHLPKADAVLVVLVVPKSTPGYAGGKK